MDKIIESLTLDWLLPYLGGRCNKLDDAAKAYYCVMNAKGSSPSELQEARGLLIDAIADVNVASEAARRKMCISCDEIAEVEDAKIERWRRRVNDAAGTADRN